VVEVQVARARLLTCLDKDLHIDIDVRFGCDVESVQKVYGCTSGNCCKLGVVVVVWRKKERGCWAMEGFK
jgi:hypothetical protein